ncbi:hypothetical protein ABPG72_015154 [Tetrahymena utriculariae]
MSSVQLPEINQNKNYSSIKNLDRRINKETPNGQKRPLYGSSVFLNTTNNNSVAQNTNNPTPNNNSSTTNLNTLNQSNVSQSQVFVALRSLDKYYKTNDIHDILGHEKDYYPQLSESHKKNQAKEVDGNLNSLKKSFNILRNKSDKREKEIQQMRSDIDKMKMQEKTLFIRTDGAGDVYSELEQEFESTKSLQEEAEMNKKTYEHMLDRMKNDIIAYKLKAHSTEDTLELGESVLTNAVLKQQQIVQKEGKAHQALEHVLKAKEEENKDREAYLENFKKQLMEQTELEKQRDERIKRQQEIAEIAANDIRDLNLKKWRKLQLVHQFLSTFLKKKMESEMKKYQGIEQAFQKIKASTGVNDAGEIVHKFLNREHTYSHLLISISDYEKRIDTLKKKNDELKSQLHRLKQEIFPIEKLEIKQDKLQIDEIYQKYKDTSDKSENCHLIESRVYDWMIRTLMKLERCIGIEKNKEQYHQDYKKSNLPDLILRITSILRENLVSLDSSEEAQNVLKATLAQKINGNIELMRRVNRVKPIVDTSQFQRSPSRDSFDKPSARESTEHLSHHSEIELNNSDVDSVDLEKQEFDYVNQLIKETKHDLKRGFAYKNTPQKA